MKIVKRQGLSKTLGKTIREINNSALRVGWGATQKYPDGESVAMIAAQNEFGNPMKRIPPRPFMRPAIESEGNNWKRQISGGIKMVLNNQISVSNVFDAVGMLVTANIQKAIKAVTSPRLANGTLDARRTRGNNSVKPLNDTGYMIASVTHEEVKK